MISHKITNNVAKKPNENLFLQNNRSIFHIADKQAVTRKPFQNKPFVQSLIAFHQN